MDIPNYIIRPYNSKDKSSLIEIFIKNTPHYFALSELKDLEFYLDYEIEYYYVIEINGKIVGGGGINFPDSLSVARISWDFIDPEFHGLGLGKILFKHRFNIIKSLKTPNIIEVRTSQLTYKFYEKLGFNIIFTEANYWAEGLDLVYMSQKLF